MNRIQLETYFSSERLNRYFAQYPGNDSKAIYLYNANISISEALYTPLSVLEVALRNKINTELSRKYGRADWYADLFTHPIMRTAWPEINNAIRHLHEDKKPITPDKVIAGLMFGFWTSLFNDRYEKELWGNLRFIFPHMPKAIRQRKNISSLLNDIRRALRNRVYHNEPVIFHQLFCMPLWNYACEPSVATMLNRFTMLVPKKYSTIFYIQKFPSGGFRGLIFVLTISHNTIPAAIELFNDCFIPNCGFSILSSYTTRTS